MAFKLTDLRNNWYRVQIECQPSICSDSFRAPRFCRLIVIMITNIIHFFHCWILFGISYQYLPITNNLQTDYLIYYFQILVQSSNINRGYSCNRNFSYTVYKSGMPILICALPSYISSPLIARKGEQTEGDMRGLRGLLSPHQPFP